VYELSDHEAEHPSGTPLGAVTVTESSAYGCDPGVAL
jgi:hypothetical protein